MATPGALMLSWRLLLGLVLLGAAGYAVVCALLYVGQRSMIYFPQPAWPGAPAGMTLDVEGAQLRISMRAHQGDAALLYFGGNAELVDASLPSLAAAFPGRALYLMNYRGYGGSTGSPSCNAAMVDTMKLLPRIMRNPATAMATRHCR